MTEKTYPKGKRGFASMDPALQRSIASDGGRAAHASGRGHKFNSESAREAAKRSWANRRKAAE